MEATDRRRLERLCRYVILPPVASGRLRFVDAQTLVFSLKTQWADGTCQLVLSRASNSSLSIPRSALHRA
ncbi:MAG: hypothetical protein CME13_00975 [Gemmatimonadetes bacterium]|nr:hypothetical protein [Gemmatimonadota bacterium]